MTTEARRPFDLENGPVMRVRIFSRSATDHVLLLAVHHVAVDLWSITILLDELRFAYAAYSAGESPVLPELDLQYADFANKQAQLLDGETGDRLFSYWQKQLSGELPILNLPSDRPRPPMQTFNGASQTFQLSPELTQQLKALSRAKESTLYVTLLAAFQVLLYRYTHQEEILVGSPTAGRNHRKYSGIVGDFVNAVTLKANFTGDPTFQEFLLQVRDTVRGAIQHQDYPFSRLVERMGFPQGDSHPPIFQTFFVLQKLQRFGELSDFILPTASDVQIDFGGLILEPYPLPHQEGQFDLTLEMIETAECLQGNLKYNTDLFDDTTIARTIEHFQILLVGIVNDPERTVSTLPLLTATEEHQLLTEWNQTQTAYPERTVQQLFETQVERTPDAIAVAYGDRQYTYRELNSRANQLARHLQTLGVQAETLVGIYVERSMEMVVGLLGILKAGGAYVPLDPDYPAERLAFMLEDTQIPVLLTQQSLTEKISSSKAQIICLDSDRDILDSQLDENLASTTAIDRLAYVIYTSGSTGKPKGVSVIHRGIVRLLFNTDYIQLDSSDTIAQVSNSSFDAATFEIWGALLHGGKLVIIPKEIFLSPQDFAVELHEQKIDALFLTTALFNQLAGTVPYAFANLKYLLFGGEAVDPKSVKKVLDLSPPEHLLHVYGPTESTTFTSWYRVQKVSEEAITLPIGRPIANTQIYILDRYLQPVPVGIPGELYIGGDGLAKGYFNRPQLSEEKFIPNPFDACSNSKLYKTGDSARYLPDGNVEFIARLDNQVKIRGFRIELGEIEAALLQMSELEACLAVVRDKELGDKRIVLYAIPNQEAGVTIADIRNHLHEKLPAYMMPSAFVLLEEFPLTPNGKIDRKALPAPQLASDAAKAQPRNELERTLVEIWESCLGIHPIGIRDSFFDLGGHSLLAVKILAEIERKIKLKLSINQLFQFPSIAAISENLGEETARSRKACLVSMKPGNNTSPLFLIHAIGSSILFYQPLVEHLRTERPIYGIQSAFLRNPEARIHSVEGLAQYYVHQIQRVQPQGPYFLGGASFGGLVAYEIAQQLAQRGESIGALILFDRPAPGGYQSPNMGKRYQQHWQKILESGPTYLASKIKNRTAFEIDKIRANLRQKQRHLYKKLELPTEKFLGDTIVDRQTKLAESYAPEPYSGEIHVIRAEDVGEDGTVFEEDLGWSEYALGGVKVWPNPGGHMSIFKVPHVRPLANRIDSILKGKSSASISESQTQSIANVEG
ncbi:MAG: amino acid adenylation domain-containing protein [Cyanobacteria bacterium P01_F01_bin.33]